MTLARLMTGAAVIALLAQPALGQTQQQQQQQQPVAASDQQQQGQQLAQEDQQFAEEAAQGGLKEVRLGELAQDQAQSDQVRQFGQQMVQDHGQANEQLMSLAQQKGIELPQELSDDAQQTYDDLQGMVGREFDQAYVEEMVSDHEEDVEKFQQYAEQGQDPDLQSFAQETLPVLQQHLEMALQLQEQVVAGQEQQQQGQQAATGQQPATDQQQAATTGEQAAPATGQQPAVTGQQDPAAVAGQEPATTEQQQVEEAEVDEEQQLQQQAEQHVAGTIQPQEIIGLEVVNAQGEAIGEIEDIVLDQQQSPHAVLSVGGFLGIGARQVAIPLDELQVAEDQAHVSSQVTREELENLPEYDEGMFQPMNQ